MGTSSHRSPWPRAHPGAATALLLPLVLLASCTDAPVVEPGKSAAWTLVLPASFGFKGAVAGTPQADALGEAFDRVDRFRLVVRRANADEVVADMVIEVEPGRDVYNLSASVPAVVPGEQFVVVIIAMQGGTVLFESDPVTVTSVPEGATDTGESPQIELRRSGGRGRAGGDGRRLALGLPRSDQAGGGAFWTGLVHESGRQQSD